MQENEKEQSWLTKALRQPIVFGLAILFALYLLGNWMLSERQAQAHVSTLDLSPAKEVEWTDDLIAAQAEGRRHNKPVFIDFGATWCGPCQHMQTEVFYDPRVSDVLRRVICVHIDVDKDPTDASAYGVRGIPRMIMLTPQQETRMDVTGSMDAGAFSQQLHNAVGLAATDSAAAN